MPLSPEERYFDWLDYTVFGTMLLLSSLIGVYFAFFAKNKQVTTSEYLMGGRTMGIFPISMSLIARYIRHPWTLTSHLLPYCLLPFFPTCTLPTYLLFSA